MQIQRYWYLLFSWQIEVHAKSFKLTGSPSHSHISFSIWPPKINTNGSLAHYFHGSLLLSLWNDPSFEGFGPSYLYVSNLTHDHWFGFEALHINIHQYVHCHSFLWIASNLGTNISGHFKTDLFHVLYVSYTHDICIPIYFLFKLKKNNNFSQYQHGGYPLVIESNTTFPGTNFRLSRTTARNLELTEVDELISIQEISPLAGNWYAIVYLETSNNHGTIKKVGLYEEYSGVGSTNQ